MSFQRHFFSLIISSLNFGRSLAPKDKSARMALMPAWVYWFRVPVWTEQAHMACTFITFKKSTLSDSIELGLLREPRGRAFSEFGCFFGYKLFLDGKSTLFYLPNLCNSKHCKARKSLWFLCGFKVLCLSLLFYVLIFFVSPAMHYYLQISWSTATT